MRHPRAQCESEGEEAEVVLFTGGAGEDCDRPDAPPQPRASPSRSSMRRFWCVHVIVACVGCFGRSWSRARRRALGA
jgi:hypothetical protein